MRAAVTAVAEMSARELLRRRGVLLLLVLLPLAFYLVRRDLQGQSIRLLVLGVAWAVSTLALFTGCAARPLEQRLRVTGASVAALLVGRLGTMVATGAVLGAAFFGIVAVDQADVRRLWAVALMLATTIVVAAFLGGVLAHLVPRELEGALTLLCLVAVQLLADPAGSMAKALPFWSAREIGTYAIDPVGSDYLWRGLTHAAVTVVLLAGGTAVVAALRLRLARPAGPAALAVHPD